MLIWPYFAFLSFLLCLALAVYSFASNRGSRANRVFSLYCLCLSCWAASHLACLLTNPSLASLSNTITILGASFISSCFLHFALEFTGWPPSKGRLVFIFAIYLLPAVFWLLYMQPVGFHPPLEKTSWGYLPQLPVNEGLYALVAFMTLAFLAALLLIARFAVKAPSAEQRSQARWITAGSLLMLPVGLVAEVFLAKGHSMDGMYGNTLMALVSAYAIHRHGFLSLDPQPFARQIFEVLPSGIFLVDSQGAIRSANPRALQLAGAQESHLLGQPVERFLPLELREPAKKGTEKLQGVAVFEAKLLSWQKSDALPVRLWIVPLRFENQAAGTMYVIRDQGEQRQMQFQMHQAQKMAALGQLAGGVAHDFNNLLQVILSNSQLLIRKLGGTGPLAEQAEEIKKTAEKASNLTRQLLAFSRKQVLQPMLLDLNTVIKDTQTMLQSLVGRRVTLDLNLFEKLDLVKADPGQIEQVLINLAANAKDAMPQGGHLSISTANRVLVAGFDDMHENIVPGPYVVLAITDGGSGMSPEVKSHLFEPFFTTKEPGKGTGLGLATVQGIVRQSGGHIFVKSQPGQGSTFEIYLPRFEAAAEPSQAKKSAPLQPASVGPAQAASRQLPVPQPMAAHGTETILLVDDEDTLREVVADMLRHNGYRVLEASNGLEAMRNTELRAGQVHLLLTDVVMPEMGGPELVRLLLPEQRGLKVLFMSGFIGSQGLDQDLLNSAGFISKPFRSEDLILKVRSLLDAPAKAA